VSDKGSLYHQYSLIFILISSSDVTQKQHSQKNNNTLDTLLYADDQALFANREDELQYSVHHLNLIVNNFNMELSTTKTKTMAFLGKTPVTSKIFIGNSIFEKVHSFKYMGYDLSYLEQSDMQMNIQNYNTALTKYSKLLKLKNT
jgi:hypothetical protein